MNMDFKRIAFVISQTSAFVTLVPVCDDVVLCLAQEGLGTEGFCGVSVSTVVDGDTVKGSGTSQSHSGVLFIKAEAA